MGLRGKLRNPWVTAPILAVALGIAWASAAAAVGCPDVIVYRIGDKFAFIGWTMHENEYDIDDFGGYRVWMREAWKGDDFTLLREYRLGEENPEAAGYWSFPEYFEEAPVCTLWVDGECQGYVNGVRRDSATIFQNAFPYEFSVTAFSASDPQAVNYECREANRTGVLYPRVGPSPSLAYVQCIPNPYRASADWEHGGQRRVTFVGLPGEATIRIYTTSLSLVRTLTHENPESDLEFWDLLNEDDEEVAAGVYLFQVDAGEFGTTEGKIMIIK